MKLTFAKPNLKFDFTKWLPWLPFSFFITILAALGIIVGFLYYNFYETVAQVKIVYILRSQVSLTQINVPLYQQVFDRLAAKQKMDFDTKQIQNNPFISLPGEVDKKADNLEAGLELAN